MKPVRGLGPASEYLQRCLGGTYALLSPFLINAYAYVKANTLTRSLGYTLVHIACHKSLEGLGSDGECGMYEERKQCGEQVEWRK